MDRFNRGFNKYIICSFIACSITLLILSFLGYMTFAQLPIVVFCWILITLLDYLIHYQKKIVYFTSEGILINKKIPENIIRWDEIIIKENVSNKNRIFYTAILTLSNQKNFTYEIEINRFSHTSIIKLTKKYLDREHPLYRAVQDYANEYNMNF